MTPAGDMRLRIRLFAGDAPPETDAYDMLIAMGGPMGANDDDRLPWMPPVHNTL